MDDELREKLELLQFKERDEGISMTGVFKGIEIIAVEHPLKGLCLMGNHLTKRKFSSFEIFIPKDSELNSFTNVVKPIFTLISTLGEQNAKLREARDLLLPRLMNGEIEV